MSLVVTAWFLNMKPLTRQLKHDVKRMKEPLRSVRMQTDYFEATLRKAIESSSAEDRAAGLEVDSIVTAGLRELLRASQAGHPIIIGD